MFVLALMLQAPEPAADSVTWTTVGGDLLSAAIAALLTFLIFALRAMKPLLQEWIAATVEKIKDERVRERVHLVREQVETAVYNVSQTLVPKVKEAAADGKVTPEERKNLLKAAQDDILDAFDQDFWDDFMEQQGFTEGALRKWLTSEVEARVFRMKMERGE